MGASDCNTVCLAGERPLIVNQAPKGCAEVLEHALLLVAAINAHRRAALLQLHSGSLKLRVRDTQACSWMETNHEKGGDYHVDTFIGYRYSSAHHSNIGGRTSGQIRELQNSFRL
jgi:hypothetical protein